MSYVDSTGASKKHDWGMFFLGILLVICSIILMAWPETTLVWMALFAGFMLLFAAGADLSTFFSTPKGTDGRGWIMASAIIDIILGAMFVIHPIATASVLPWLAGGFVIGYGIVAIVSAVGLRSVGSTWVVLLLSGILSILIGFMFFIDPTLFVIWVGVYIALRGIMMCVYGVVAPRNLPYM